MSDDPSGSLDGKSISNLRVVDLKLELEKRGLSKSGSKKELVKRLKQKLELEKLYEEAAASSVGVSEPKLHLDEATEQNEFVKQYFSRQKEMKRLVELREKEKEDSDSGLKDQDSDVSESISIAKSSCDSSTNAEEDEDAKSPTERDEQPDVATQPENEPIISSCRDTPESEQPKVEEIFAQDLTMEAGNQQPVIAYSIADIQLPECPAKMIPPKPIATETPFAESSNTSIEQCSPVPVHGITSVHVDKTAETNGNMHTEAIEEDIGPDRGISANETELATRAISQDFQSPEHVEDYSERTVFERRPVVESSPDSSDRTEDDDDIEIRQVGSPLSPVKTEEVKPEKVEPGRRKFACSMSPEKMEKPEKQEAEKKEHERSSTKDRSEEHKVKNRKLERSLASDGAEKHKAERETKVSMSSDGAEKHKAQRETKVSMPSDGAEKHKAQRETKVSVSSDGAEKHKAQRETKVSMTSDGAEKHKAQRETKVSMSPDRTEKDEIEIGKPESPFSPDVIEKQDVETEKVKKSTERIGMEKVKEMKKDADETEGNHMSMSHWDQLLKASERKEKSTNNSSLTRKLKRPSTIQTHVETKARKVSEKIEDLPSRHISKKLDTHTSKERDEPKAKKAVSPGPEKESEKKISKEKQPEAPPRKITYRKLNISFKRSEIKPEEDSEKSNDKKQRWQGYSSVLSKNAVSISTDSLKSLIPDFNVVKSLAESENECKFNALESPVDDNDKKVIRQWERNNSQPNKPKRLSVDVKTEIVKDPVEKIEVATAYQEPTSKIVFIQNLVRPFTVPQLKEVLKEYGTIDEDEFWVDRIKSKCIVAYETLEEAGKALNTLHSSKWPSSNPKILICSYVSPDEVDGLKLDSSKPAMEALPKATRVSAHRESRTEQQQQQQKKVESPEEKPRDNRRARDQPKEDEVVYVREWDKEKLLRGSPVRERTKRPLSRERERRRSEERKRERKMSDSKKKHDEATPAKLLDDLFQKTKATPCIYWLPLTEEQVKQRLERREQRRLEREKKNQEEEEERRARRKLRDRDTRSRSRSPVRRR